MAIDPSIIGNVMVPQAPQMPDVNAMMQTRTRGMENIYKIETARQEQAKAEAAAQAEAQENALVQALLPAYTYGIETGDMAGALDLVPPEMQANVLPYVQALEGKPPEQVRAALIGSLSTSKAGQEALAAMQKAAALGVQQGQLKVSQQRLAQDAATVGQPKPMSEYEANVIRLREQEAAAKAAQDAAVASGEAPPVQLQKGERWNPETQRVEAAPGSQTYNKQKAAHSDDFKGAVSVIDTLTAANRAVSDLKNTSGWQKTMGTGSIMSRMPNTPLSSVTGAYDFQTKYDNLKGAVAVLGRAAASMSGKLGNMAVQEWKAVSDAVAALDLTRMDADTLDRQLDIIATQIAATENSVRRAYEQEYGGSQFYTPLTGGAEGEPPPRGAPNDVDDPLGIR